MHACSLKIVQTKCKGFDIKNILNADDFNEIDRKNRIDVHQKFFFYVCVLVNLDIWA